MAKNQPHRSDREETHHEDQQAGQRQFGTQRGDIGDDAGMDRNRQTQGQQGMEQGQRGSRQGEGGGMEGGGRRQGGGQRDMGTSPGGVGLGGGFSEEQFEEESIGAMGAGREFGEDESDLDEETRRRQQQKRSDA